MKRRLKKAPASEGGLYKIVRVPSMIPCPGGFPYQRDFSVLWFFADHDHQYPTK